MWAMRLDWTRYYFNEDPGKAFFVSGSPQAVIEGLLLSFRTPVSSLSFKLPFYRLRDHFQASLERGLTAEYNYARGASHSRRQTRVGQELISVVCNTYHSIEHLFQTVSHK